MSKKVIIITVLIVIGLICIFVAGMMVGSGVYKKEIEIKTNRATIDELFSNFPESKKLYYTSESLYSKRSIGPEIYQIDILAELTDNSYDNFINQVEFENSEDFKIKINPNNINYNWKKIKNIQVIKSIDVEDASITNIYLDENTKTIYVIALGGN